MTDQDTDFTPFEGEPVLLLPAFRSSSRGRGESLVDRSLLIACIPLFVLVAAVAVIAIIQPPSQNVLGRLCADLLQLDGAPPATPGVCAPEPSTAFPISRDLLSLYAALSLAVTSIFIRRKWGGMANLVSYMTANGSITFRTADGRQELLQEVARSNRHIRRMGALSPLVMLAIAVGIYSLMFQQASRGVFYNYAPDSVDPQAWARASYASWWASPNVSLLGAITYFTVATWGCYLVTQQNLVGLRVIWAFWRTRKHVLFGASLGAKYNGWEPVRMILSGTYTEIMVHGVAIACVASMMPPGSFFGPLGVAAYQWLLVVPIYAAFPFVFVRPQIARVKREKLAQLEESQKAIVARRAMSPTPDWQHDAEMLAIGNVIADVDKIRTLPLATVKEAIWFVLALCANLFAVVPVILAITHR